jgi:hypothetical protein
MRGDSRASAKMHELRTVNGLGNLGRLLQSGDTASSPEWSAETLKRASQVEALVLCREHANCDSLPLRFGVHFAEDTRIALRDVRFLYVDAKYADRFHVDAQFSSDGLDHAGRFVVGIRRGYRELVVVTAWRHDANTEARLSEVMTALRTKGFISPQTLLDLHPLYLAGKIRTSADLIEQLANQLSLQQTTSMQRVVDEALARADAAIAERDQAVRRAQNAEAVAREASFIVDDLQNEKQVLKSRVDELEEERRRYQREAADAQRKGEKASLSDPDTLVDVLVGQMHRNSSCTILVMGDGSRRHMKTASFDRDGRVTAKAKSLIGRKVQISCWDPVDQPGRWSRDGYFRQVYAAE